MPVKYAPKAFRALRGVFAVYKPSGVGVSTILQKIQTKLADDLNNLKQGPPNQMVVYKPASTLHLVETAVDTFSKNSSAEYEDLLVPVNVDDWFNHPLVQGPRYSSKDLVLSVGHTLDSESCGVQVIGLQNKGERILDRIRRANMPRTYKVRGRFGVGTVDGTPHTKVMNRATWHHISRESISRVLVAIQGAHRNAMIKSSGFDLSSQSAYLIACKGLLKPQTPHETLVINMKLGEVDLPDFEIEVVCTNESSNYLRRVISQIARELYTCSMCTRVQRTVDGVFTLRDTILDHNVTTATAIDAISEYDQFLLSDGSPLLRRHTHYAKIADRTNSAERRIGCDENLQSLTADGGGDTSCLKVVAAT